MIRTSMKMDGQNWLLLLTMEIHRCSGTTRMEHSMDAPNHATLFVEL